MVADKACSDVKVYDMEVTNHRLVLVSNHGIHVSNDLRHISSNSPNVTFKISNGSKSFCTDYKVGIKDKLTLAICKKINTAFILSIAKKEDKHKVDRTC